MQITWSRPRLLDCNGDILEYIIMVDSGSDKHSYSLEVNNDYINTTSTESQCLSYNYNVSNQLIPHKRYSVKIAAVNINGTGPFSDTITVMSGENGKPLYEYTDE